MNHGEHKEGTGHTENSLRSLSKTSVSSVVKF